MLMPLSEFEKRKSSHTEPEVRVLSAAGSSKKNEAIRKNI